MFALLQFVTQNTGMCVFAAHVSGGDDDEDGVVRGSMAASAGVDVAAIIALAR